MGNLYEEWGNQETQVDTEGEIPLYSEPDRSFLSNKEILEKKNQFHFKGNGGFLPKRLERVLKIFNRMR